MDYSEEGSPLFWVPAKFRRRSEWSHVDDETPPPPWGLPPTGGHRRISDDIPSILSDQPEDQSYVADGALRPSCRRRLSLPPRPLTTEKAMHASDFTSDEPRTSPQHPQQAQSIKKDDLKNAALSRATRRYSRHHPTVDDEVTSYQVMPTGTLATVSDTRYSSHARGPRNLGKKIRAPTRQVTSSPPRRRVVVLSKTLPSSLSTSPPIDDFTDIPPVELILFEPPKSLTAEVQRPGYSVGPLMSSPLKITQGALKKKSLDKDETHSALPSPSATAPQPAMSTADVKVPPSSPAEPAAIGRVSCMQMWVISVAAAATLTLPLGMVILSYLSTPARDMSNFTGGPFGTTKISGTAKTVVHTYQFPIPPARPTLNPWEGFQAKCQQIKQINDHAHLVSPQRSPPLSQSRRPNIFCLYNNTRFHRGGNHDFLPQNIPFSHCQNLIYWSFGIMDGVPTSRAENFDRMYGLGKLREIANNSNNPGVKILLTMGGYLEDYAQLSLLGRDSRGLTRFVHSTMALMSSHVLDGVVIHWMIGAPTCRSRAVNDTEVLHAILFGLRRIFRLNNFPGQLAVIVPLDKRRRIILVDSVVDLVDYVFMDNRELWHWTIDTTICLIWSHDVLTRFSSQKRYIGNERKFCVVMSVAPFLVETFSSAQIGQAPQLIRLSNFSNYGSDPGMGNAFDMCRSPGACRVSDPNSRSSCIFVRGSPPASPPLLYMFNNLMLVADIFRNSRRNLTNQCMLLVDLDLDNYARQCGHALDDYWFIRYVDEALNATAPTYLRRTMIGC
ncbi:hypothetical protein HPB49_025078 [Dermacentor silvarum]|uniref:Uncharacterized protein n=1 Tax=Dermacentor silvarum TaxID=543639 RepID=A0ACB8CC82_DERSI|nr:hypothetical protein HPB49_025078 [Dermacentor silvarum]